MSGRIHLFLTPDNDIKLKELVAAAGVADQELGESHVCQVATERLLEKFKYNAFTDAERAELSAVPDPVNYGRRHCFMKQTNVNRLFDLIRKFGIEDHDYSLQHVVQTAVSWLYAEWKSGTILPALFERLQKVEQPKVIYHR